MYMDGTRGKALVFLFLFVCGSLLGQIVTSDTHTLGLASASNPTILTGVHGLYANPASIHVGSYKWQATTSGLNRYGTDIFTFSGAASFNFNESIGLGLSVGSHGISGFKENFATLSFSRQVGSASYLALQPQLYRLDVEGLGQRTTWDVTLGYFGHLSSSLNLSAHVEQIRSFLSSDDDRAGSVVCLA